MIKMSKKQSEQLREYILKSLVDDMLIEIAKTLKRCFEKKTPTIGTLDKHFHGIVAIVFVPLFI